MSTLTIQVLRRVEWFRQFLIDNFHLQLDRLRKQIEKTPLGAQAKLFEEKTKIPFEYLLIGVVVVASVLLFFGIGAGLIWWVGYRSEIL